VVGEVFDRKKRHRVPPGKLSLARHAPPRSSTFI
jgi:hypothetical protein